MWIFFVKNMALEHPLLMSCPLGITLEKQHPKIPTLGEEFLYQTSKNDSIFFPLIKLTSFFSIQI